MKISVNDIKLFELTETQKAVIKNDIHADEFDADMARRLEYILTHKYERCFERLKKEWDTKLPSLGVTSVPTDPEEYAQLVFAQPCYKCRKTRDLEAKAVEEARLSSIAGE